MSACSVWILINKLSLGNSLLATVKAKREKKRIPGLNELAPGDLTLKLVILHRMIVCT